MTRIDADLFKKLDLFPDWVQLHKMLHDFAFKKGETDEFTLASGLKSNFYLNCKEVMFRPHGAWLIGRLLYAWIEHSGFRNNVLPRQWESGEHAPYDNLGGVGGLEMGAIPIAISVTITSHLAGRPLPAFIVRKTPKDHGTGAKIEGLTAKPHQAVVVVEDVSTTGQSAYKAVEALKQVSCSVAAVVSLVNRNEGADELFAERDVAFYSLYEREDFMGG